MSLVPYTSSDISDSEEENEETEQIQVTVNSTKINVNNTGDDENKSHLFTSLPTPIQNTENTLVEEEDDEFLRKKPANVQKSTVKITIPSLSEIEKDEDTTLKKFKPSSKGTGLFSILPPPKCASISSNKLIPRSISQPKKPIVPKVIKKPVVDESIDTKTEEAISSCDFFSLTVEEEPLPEYIEPVIEKNEPTVINKPFDQNEYAYQPEEVQVSEESLNEEALRALCGTRGVKRKQVTEILTINEAEVRPSASEWLKQTLIQGQDGVDPQAAARAVPGGVQKRKHQITYLAQQAKANEQQLLNTWAQNRATRQQTQSKYGF